MKTRHSWVLLALSVCFNLFFAIGYARTRLVLRDLETPEGRERLVAERLDLDHGQRREFDRVGDEIRAAVDRYRRANAGSLDEFWAEMVKDRPDPRRIEAMVLDRTKLREGLNVQMVLEMLKFVQVLDQRQKEAYVRIVRKQGRVW